MKQKVLAEFIGTAFLLAIIVGSGIMGESLSQGNSAIALLANSIATGAGLFVLIESLSPLSGAHFNPAVSLVEFLAKRLNSAELICYCLAQFTGAFLGIVMAHAMFQQKIWQISTKERVSPTLWLSEIIATFALICVINLTGNRRTVSTPACVSLYITAAYWFTSSTSFANPAVSIARAFTNTFCGIAPGGVLAFIAAQTCGALIAFALLKNIRSQTES